jgi:sensor histidine kinase YesM
MLKRSWPRWVLLGVVCTLFGLLDAFGSYAASNVGRYTINWQLVLSWDLIAWNLWVVLAPFILWTSRHLRIDSARWFRSAFTCALVGLFFALAHSALLVTIYFSVIPDTGGLHSFLVSKYFVLISDFLIGFAVSGSILMFSFAAAYYQQYRQEELKASQLEAQLVQSHLQALKMQLHPHFLFNTLNSISALQIEDGQAAQRMTARLGDFLRLTLENVGTQEVTLKQEMEFLKCYLDIERVRFQHRLTVNIQVEPDALDANVPNLILQPIVENAIRHGIAQRIAPGRLDISAKREEMRLCIEVKDNGPGLSTNGGTPKIFKEGVGLANTRARLNQLYGPNCSFKMENIPEGGLRVRLEVPFLTTASAMTGIKRTLF